MQFYMIMYLTWFYKLTLTPTATIDD